MTIFYTQNVKTGRYFLLPGHGTTACKRSACIYTQEKVNEHPSLVRSLGRGVTQRVPA